MNKHAFYEYLQEIPIVNSHSHHRRPEEQNTLNLENVLKLSYLRWCGDSIPDGEDREQVSMWIDHVGNRCYYVWLEKALMKIYGIEDPLSADTWWIYDEAIYKTHQDEDSHIDMLKNICGYEAVMLDAFWDAGYNGDHPELFKPVYRFNSFIYGHNHTAGDQHGHNIQNMCGTDILNIDEYVDFLEKLIIEKWESGCTALKTTLAYTRTLAIDRVTKEQAQKAMCAEPDKESEKYFQDYIMETVCEIAAGIGMPVQIHTGLGKMRGSNAMNLQPLIERHPENKFILMHGSYPWLDDICGLTHNYSNIWADLCWLPIISVSAAKRMLHELIDVCNADHIIWGCDSATAEESYSAKLAMMDVLADVLTERVEAGVMREKSAERYAQMLLHDNGAKLIYR